MALNQSLYDGLLVLRFFLEGDPHTAYSLKEVHAKSCPELDYSKMRRLLQTLENADMVEQTTNKKWRISRNLLELPYRQFRRIQQQYSELRGSFDELQRLISGGSPGTSP